MLNVLSALVATLFAILMSSHLRLASQGVAPVNRNETVSFYSVFDLTKPSGAQPALRGARLADPKDWPASFYSVHPGGSCTSTLVGPRALLTAAHCAPNNGIVTVHLTGKVYSGRCTQSDLYSPDSSDKRSADWAMCLMESEIPVSRYETVNSDPLRIKLGTQLLLTGFGCTQSTGTGGNDGNYRIGEAKITGVPSGSNNDIMTTGDVALCYGDSGGPAFMFLDVAKKKRIQVSVNSRIQVLENGKLGNNSFLSSVSTEAAQEFLKAWATSHGAQVCGLNANTDKCRN